MRSLVYIFYVAAESIESQRKGIVFVFYPSTCNGFDVDSILKTLPRPHERKLASKFNKALPIRPAAIHLCFPESIFFRIFRSILLLSFRSSTRFRFKTHSGQWTEFKYQLMGYGIPIDILPISQTGKIKTILLQQWIRLRKSIEAPPGMGGGQDGSGSDDSDGNRPLSASALLSAIECPNLNDVIFRTGKSYMCHPGNVMFRSLIESKLDEHFAATRKEKATIAWWIVNEVERRGGRFLKWDNRGWWTEFADREGIRYKIPTYFRDFTRNMKARRNRIMNNNVQQQQQQQRQQQQSS